MCSECLHRGSSTASLWLAVSFNVCFGFGVEVLFRMSGLLGSGLSLFWILGFWWSGVSCTLATQIPNPRWLGVGMDTYSGDKASTAV